uniref:Synuclein gamma n=1 Tax=Equus caballus TaxID=9796 RepID=A0A9L0TEJ9_HORSE
VLTQGAFPPSRGRAAPSLGFSASTPLLLRPEVTVGGLREGGGGLEARGCEETPGLTSVRSSRLPWDFSSPSVLHTSQSTDSIQTNPSFTSAPGKAHSCPPRLKCYQEASVYRTLPLGLTFPILTAAGAAVQQVVDQATEAGQKAMDQAAKSTQETIDKTANQASETFSGFGKKLGLLK